jgi:hypothetical protein
VQNPDLASLRLSVSSHVPLILSIANNRDIGSPDVDNGAVKGALLDCGRGRTARTAFLFALCVLAGFLAGCDSAPVTPVAPSPAAPSPSIPRHTLSGTVSEFINGVPRPVGADLTVWLWVEQQIPQGRMGSSQSARTDQNGRYSLSVPDSRVFASLGKQGALQPCLASAEVRSDTTLDVELISESDTLSGRVPDHWLSAHPLVTGEVYEATAGGGRIPLSGATIIVDVLVDVYQAFTKTDERGRFFLCRVNGPIRMDFELTGYEGTSRSVRGDTDIKLEIALTRR